MRSAAFDKLHIHTYVCYTMWSSVLNFEWRTWLHTHTNLLTESAHDSKNDWLPFSCEIHWFSFDRGDNRWYECPVFQTRDRGPSSFVFLSTLRILEAKFDPRSGDEVGPRSGDEVGPRSGDEVGPRSGDGLGLCTEFVSNGWKLLNVALVMHTDKRRV